MKEVMARKEEHGHHHGHGEECHGHHHEHDEECHGHHPPVLLRMIVPAYSI